MSDWREPEPEFVFARLQCSNRLFDAWVIWPDKYPDNPPWHHDYPYSDELFVGLIHELTGIRVSPKSSRSFRSIAMRSSSTRLCTCPNPDSWYSTIRKSKISVSTSVGAASLWRMISGRRGMSALSTKSTFFGTT